MAGKQNGGQAKADGKSGNKRRSASPGQSGQVARGELLTTAEVCERYQVSRRTVLRWKKAGLTVHRREGAKSDCFDTREVEDYLSRENRNGRRTLSRSQETPDPEPEPEASGAQEKSAAQSAPTPGVSEELREVVRSGDDLKEIIGRLRDAEKTTYKQWVAAIEHNKQQRDPKKKYSTNQVNDLQDQWKNMVETRRKFEKDLPGFLLEHRRYVDIEMVSKVVADAYGTASAELDQIGVSVAPRCEGKSTGEIRVLIDDAVKNAKEHIRTAWQQIQQNL